jgi:serine/threonine protein kinase
MTPSDVGVDVGQVLEGKYRVDAILGHGGMGVVVACTHLALGERYALKLLRRDVLSDQDAVERFIREARAAVRLKSEFVAKVTELGMYDGDLPYMVMEYLEGHDVGQLLEERHTLAIPWATELTLQAAEALTEAHSLGIVHRDVKPTNLFVTWRPDGSAMVKVLDFGISKSALGTDMKLTQTQSVLGTPAYMSPEQMRSAHMVDSRSDIWSLGCVLYEMIEGVRPFEAESFSEMCVKVAVDPPRPMEKAPPQLAAVIEHCLEKQPEQRYSTMAELCRDLVPFAPNAQQAQHLVDRMARMLQRSSLGWDGNPSMSLPAISRVQSSPLITDKIATSPPPRRRKWPWAIAVFAFGAIGAALAIVVASPGDVEPRLPSAIIERATHPVIAPAPVEVTPTPVVPPTPPPMPTPTIVEASQPTKPIRHVKQAALPAIPTATGSAAGSAAPTDCDAFHSQHGTCKP